MAKQSLYLMKNELGLFKIGISVNPEKRRNEIKNSSGFNVELIKAWETTDSAATVERKLHSLFSSKRTHGEWFTDLTIEDIESNIDTPSEWKPKPKVRKNALKLKPLHIPTVNKKPICETILEDRLHKTMEEIPKTYEEMCQLGKRQEKLMNDIVKIKKKSNAHQYIILDDKGGLVDLGTGAKKYFDNLLSTVNVISPSFWCNGELREVTKFELCITGNAIHPSTTSPWLTTKQGAIAVNRIVRDQRINDAMSGYDVGSDRITNMFKPKPTAPMRRRQKLSEITQEEIDQTYHDFVL